MDSRVNEQNDKQEVLKEEQFRRVFFDQAATSGKSGQGAGAGAGGPGLEDKRVRLENAMKQDESMLPTTKQIPVMSMNGGSGQARGHGHPHPHALTHSHVHQHSHQHSHQHVHQHVHSQHSQHNHQHTHSHGHKKRKSPKFIRKFRSRSLPIINYTKTSHFQHYPKINQTATVPPLPPINTQSLKEIDLHEILKNPQLRHDILFDPQLQFRPNLDGARGKRKKTIIDEYWMEIEKECCQFFETPTASQERIRISRLPILFTSLRDILLSLLPYKDRATVNEIMDIELLIQQLSHGSFDFVALSQWLGEVFKAHCAPMRDQWVSDMISKFRQAYYENSVDKLVQGLRMIFLILEAMKLDVANHQIRILRPVLTETAVDFERDYFSQLISNKKIDISGLLKWFHRMFVKKFDALNNLMLTDKLNENNMRVVLVSSIIDLLSCRNMATEFPSTLAFDHTRLVLLRADVRQLVCVQLCVVLYKQLLLNHQPSASYRSESFKSANINKVLEEILAIVTDDNGNVKWTRNVQSIALQLVKNVVTNPATGKMGELSQSMIQFAHSWLVKQIQPISDVYGLMEEKIFRELLSEVLNSMDKLSFTAPVSTTTLNTSEMLSIANRIATLVKFHWSVFGGYYTQKMRED